MLMLNERIFWECAPHASGKLFPCSPGSSRGLAKPIWGCLRRSRMQATEHEKDAEAGVKLEPLYCIAHHRLSS